MRNGIIENFNFAARIAAKATNTNAVPTSKIKVSIDYESPPDESNSLIILFTSCLAPDNTSISPASIIESGMD